MLKIAEKETLSNICETNYVADKYEIDADYPNCAEGA